MSQADVRNTASLPGSDVFSLENETFGILAGYNRSEAQFAPFTLGNVLSTPGIEAVFASDTTGNLEAVTFDAGHATVLHESPGRSYSTPTIISVRPIQIVYGTEIGREGAIVSYSDDDARSWRHETVGRAATQPLVFDVDQDGELEIIFNHYSRSAIQSEQLESSLTVMSLTGLLEGEWFMGSGTTDWAPTLIDLHEDGDVDLVGARLDLKSRDSCLSCSSFEPNPAATIVYGLDLETLAAGTLLATKAFEFERPGFPARSPIAADFNGDGSEEVALAIMATNPFSADAFLGEVVALDAAGTIISTYEPDHPLYFGIALLEHERAPGAQLVVGTSEGVSLLSLGEGWEQTSHLPIGPVRALAVADVLPSPGPEIIAGTMWFDTPQGPGAAGSVVILDRDGSEVLYEYELPFGGITDLAIADVDLDESLDVVAYTTRGVALLFGPGSDPEAEAALEAQLFSRAAAQPGGRDEQTDDVARKAPGMGPQMVAMATLIILLVRRPTRGACP